MQTGHSDGEETFLEYKVAEKLDSETKYRKTKLVVN